MNRLHIYLVLPVLYFTLYKNYRTWMCLYY